MLAYKVQRSSTLKKEDQSNGTKSIGIERLQAIKTPEKGWIKKAEAIRLRSIPTALMSEVISEQPYPDAALHKLINFGYNRVGRMILVMATNGGWCRCSDTGMKCLGTDLNARLDDRKNQDIRLIA